ncbi:Ribosome biogenesis protein [Giardia muris]|uniref:Ribosome biogenesis protein n=1 Tax=Giardia muris TaxID=5742 RepID=A0A4Z1SR74_GIAMU|nr:Ribosome biogenesis protein [Giardia muris]|eukprot:TNJ27465.1 Ribosome biogenesis protein [Giardia muris]
MTQPGKHRGISNLSVTQMPMKPKASARVNGLTKAQQRKLTKREVIEKQRTHNLAKGLRNSTPKHIAVVALSEGVTPEQVWKQIVANCPTASLPATSSHASVYAAQGQAFIPIFVSLPEKDVDLMDRLDSLMHSNIFLFVTLLDGPSAAGISLLNACAAMRLNQPQIALAISPATIASDLILDSMSLILNTTEMGIPPDTGVDAGFTSATTQRVLSHQQLRTIKTHYHPDVYLIAPFEARKHSESLIRRLGSMVISDDGGRPGWLRSRPTLPILATELEDIDATLGVLRFSVTGWLCGQLPLTADQNAYVQSVGVCAITGIEVINSYNPSLALEKEDLYPSTFTPLQTRTDQGETLLARRHVGAPEDAGFSLIPTLHEGRRSERMECDDQPHPQAGADAGGDGLPDDDEDDYEYIQMENEYEAKLRYQSDEPWEYPDELDIHPTAELRSLLQGWRGLRSARSSPWKILADDVPAGYETLYHIHQPVQVFTYAKNELLLAGRTAPGNLLRVHLEFSMQSMHLGAIFAEVEGAGQYLPRLTEETLREYYEQLFTHLSQETLGSRLRGLIGLYRFENRDSIAHCTVSLADLPSTFGIPDAPPIRPGDPTPLTHEHPFIIYAGFRRIYTAPLPSQLLAPGRSKMVRYYHTTEQSITMSFVCPLYLEQDALPHALFFYTPSLTSTSTVLGEYRFCGSGKITTFDTTFITLQRIVLAGTPFHINRRYATVRHMFFSPEDVKYFAPLDLYTENGGTGRILQPMGLKGYFKAHFDTQITHGTAIKLAVYRQAFPPMLSLRLDGGDGLFFPAACYAFATRIANTQEQLAALATETE